MRKLIKNTIDAYLDWRSFKTASPIVVIESDDWGSLRTKDNTVKNKLNQINPTIKNDIYTQLDSIATQDDLEALFEVLHSVKDAHGNPACITPNVCTANPDFKAIKEADFQKFFYKPFTDTLDEYSDNKSLFKTWQEGTVHNVFKPQLHGREHLHALAWLAELRAGNKDLLKAFELENWGIPYKALSLQRRKNVQAALDIYHMENERAYHKQWIKDSIVLFKNAFGYTANSFIPPAYVWDSSIYKHLSENGIKIIQGIKIQSKPAHTDQTKYKKILHFIGQLDRKSKIRYMTRNAFFEPYSSDYFNKLTSENDWVDSTMHAVNKAIKLNKPVILGSHRINYIGRLNIDQRDENLKILKLILKQITKQHPDVQFLDSGSLAKMICQESNNMN